MPHLNNAVLGAVAHALSNDRYPKDGVGYVVSDSDRRTIERTIQAEMVAGAEDAAIEASIRVFARQYQGAPADQQEDWAKRNIDSLDALVDKLPVLRARIGGEANGPLEKAKSLAKALSEFDSVIGLDVREDGPDTTATHRSAPELQGASRSRLMREFSEDRRGPDHAAGEFAYAKGEQAIERFLARVEFSPDFVDPDEAARLTRDRFTALLADPAIEQIHFVGSWAGEDWGVAGSADMNLILELDGGNFVHLQTSGGWQ
jgi:hypothetical protein